MLPKPPIRHLPDHMCPLALLRAHRHYVPRHSSPAESSAKRGHLYFAGRGHLNLGLTRQTYDNTISSRVEFIAKQPRPSFVCDDATAIAVPVLLTTGELSPPFFKRIVAEIERCLPQARRHTIAEHRTRCRRSSPRCSPKP